MQASEAHQLIGLKNEGHREEDETLRRRDYLMDDEKVAFRKGVCPKRDDIVVGESNDNECGDNTVDRIDTVTVWLRQQMTDR